MFPLRGNYLTLWWFWIGLAPMARPLRIEFPGAIYHVMSRGNERGAIVRSRRQVLNAKSDRPAARSPRAAVASALGSPLLASSLPLRVASFALQGPERDKVQLLIHADVGTDYASSKAVAVGYMIVDKEGRQIDTKSEAVRLVPSVAGVPSPLGYTAGASVPPGVIICGRRGRSSEGRHDHHGRVAGAVRPQLDAGRPGRHDCGQ